MRSTSNHENEKPHNPHLDHYVIRPVSREFAQLLMSEGALREIDEAKHKLAETVGVREEHIRLEIQMLVVAEV